MNNTGFYPSPLASKQASKTFFSTKIHHLGFRVRIITMEMEDDGDMISKPTAMIACTGMALLFVATLYAPTLILRLPPPSSFESFMIRRFVCAAVSSSLSLFLSLFILPVSSQTPLSLSLSIYRYIYVC